MACTHQFLHRLFIVEYKHCRTIGLQWWLFNSLMILWGKLLKKAQPGWPDCPTMLEASVRMLGYLQSGWEGWLSFFHSSSGRVLLIGCWLMAGLPWFFSGFFPPVVFHHWVVECEILCKKTKMKAACKDEAKKVIIQNPFSCILMMGSSIGLAQIQKKGYRLGSWWEEEAYRQ